MVDLDIILQGRGLEGIPFGSLPEDVRRVLNKPDSATLDEEGDATWEYESLGLAFTFWGEYGNRLGYIGTERANASLNGLCLMGSSKERVLSFIASDLAAEVTEDRGCIHEDGSEQSWLDVDSLNLTFWFTDGSLYLMDWTLDWVSETSPW